MTKIYIYFECLYVILAHQNLYIIVRFLIKAVHFKCFLCN